jgi:hypothetical protein
MLHLLHLYGDQGLTRDQLRNVGIDCYADTIYPLLQGHAVETRGPLGLLHLSEQAATVLRECLVVQRKASDVEMRADYPEAFVIMPFNEPWSQKVYSAMIEPAIVAAKLRPVRGDSVLRNAALLDNLRNAILRAGVVIADVTGANLNVFLELGLATGMGRDTMILKEEASPLPADLAGAHYYAYRSGAPAKGRALLQTALADWAERWRAFVVKDLGG